MDLKGFVSGDLFDATVGGKDGTGGGVLLGRECWTVDNTGAGEEGNGGGPLLAPLEGIGGGPRPPLGVLTNGVFFFGIGGGPLPCVAETVPSAGLTGDSSGVTVLEGFVTTFLPAKQSSHTRCFLVGWILGKNFFLAECSPHTTPPHSLQ